MIKGAKAGQQQQRQPVIAKDSAASISYLKILYGLSEGEISGLADGAKSIYLDDTPLLDDSGNPNFKDDNGNLAVTWDFRSGTNDQEYIKGFPSVENETNINVELKSGTPYVKTVTNSQLSAVRLRLSWAALRKQETNGDVNGITIEYAIDLSTNGGAYQQVLLTKVSDKTSAKYERSHRIDLPRGSTWNIRVRRITPNATSDLISDKMYVDAITEIIDAKLRYPNTAMLGLQYNAATFSNVAKLAVRCKGKIISVPSNYDPVTRTYNGIWDGTFKQAYSNNPAWVYYDICTQWRYGLGSRITAAMIDKWSLYALAQYCDQQVSDGKGGQEPRFTVNVYLQAQQDAFAVLQSLAAIFRAMSYWQGEQIVLDADLPKDPVYTFSRANVVDGEFSYTGTRARDRHTIAKVAWDNPAQKFKTEYEFVRDEAAIAKYGVKVLDLSIVGCTSQGQAQRAGLWALKSEQLETRAVTFKTGLDGFIPTVGSIINVSDEVLAGRANGGRVSAVSADLLTVTLDRDVIVNVGDTLIVNADNGKAQRRIVSAVNGRAVTVSVAFSGVSSQNVWAVDSSDLKTMRFRVLSIKQDDVTFTITALQHEPQKYDAIDYGAIVEQTAISIIKPNVIDAPKNVAITQRNRVEQGQNITTMIVSWEQVSGAVAYDVEWRKDNGNWTKVPRTGNNSVEIDGVYSGNYLARVAAVSAFDLVSKFATSMLTAAAGKIGAPPTLANLKATGILFGMRLDWLFAQGSSDTNYTEIQVASAPDTNVALLGTYAYPTNTATINGLQGNLTQYYRGRIVDKLGNVSDWSNWVSGTTDASADKVLTLLSGQINQTQLAQDLATPIAKIPALEIGSANANSRIASLETATSDNKQAIATTQQQLTAKFDALAVGGRNLALNSGVVVNNYYAGITTKSPLVIGETYTLSFGYIGTPSGYVFLNRGVGANFTAKSTDTWQRGSVTFMFAKNDYDFHELYPHVYGATSLRNIKLERGNIATDWTPAPEDIDAKFATTDATINEFKKTQATKDSALSQRIDTIKSVSDKAAADITTINQTKIDASQAQAIATSTTNARFDALSVGGRNYFKKSTPVGGYLAAVNRNHPECPNGFEGTGSVDESNNIRLGNVITGNGYWTVSGWVRGIQDTPIGFGIDICNNPIKWIIVNADRQNNWERFSYTINVNNYSADIYNFVGFSRLSWAYFLFKDVKVEKGNVATDWTPAPEDIDAKFATTDATINEFKKTQATKDSATATQISTLQTSVGNNTASIQTQQQSINGLYAQYTVKVDVNGRVSGFGLASSSTQSDFAIRADKFYIAPPDGTGKGASPFMVLTSPQVINGVTVPVGTYIKGDLIATGSITGDKITAQTEINAPIIKGGSININDKFMVDSDGNMTALSGTFAGTISSDTIDIGSLKRSAWMGGWKYFVRSWRNGPIRPSRYDNSIPYDYELYSNGNVHPSFGGINFYFGHKGYAASNIRFMMNVNCKHSVTKTQRLLVVDDFIYIYLNGNMIANYSNNKYGGEVNLDITYNLQQGYNRIEFLLGNDGGPVQLLVMGDIVDNNVVRFA